MSWRHVLRAAGWMSFCDETTGNRLLAYVINWTGRQGL
jgi:hypothetical protein